MRSAAFAPILARIPSSSHPSLCAGIRLAGVRLGARLEAREPGSAVPHSTNSSPSLSDAALERRGIRRGDLRGCISRHGE